MEQRSRTQAEASELAAQPACRGHETRHCPHNTEDYEGDRAQERDENDGGGDDEDDRDDSEGKRREWGQGQGLSEWEHGREIQEEGEDNHASQPEEEEEEEKG